MVGTAQTPEERIKARTERRLTLDARRTSRRELEQLRDMLPVDVYVGLLHLAACTGVMPTIDPHTNQIMVDHEKVDSEGKPQPLGDPISTKERIAIAQYLVDKRLPSVKGVSYQDTGASTVDEVETIEVQTDEQLKRLAAGANVTNPFME